ncbi:S8 family serine peptidase [Candidatus Woesearchaeota archaeon]|nr:S8 family serine peptidase [Candidatus Woesearchaeota archaeon]
MRYRGVIILLVLILISIPIIFSEDTEVSLEVLENIENSEVKVIIELEQPLEDLSYKERIQSADVDLEPLIENVYKATINKEDLQELLEDPNVKSIGKDEIFQLLLTDSVPLINASTVHIKQYSTLNLTGLTQTICIIDSGINATYPDFNGRVIEQKCFCNVSNTGLSGGGCCPDLTFESNTATDDHGHGTHVAGIAAGNGTTILGVAPEANIIAVKVSNSAGTVAFADILSAVNWCVDNATIYNISVITISIGGGIYQEECDSTYPALSSEIETAWNSNISVTISTGNSGSTTYMTAPACIAKAISISSTTKTDAISSFSNRNSLTDIFAPGSSIISAALSGGTVSNSGTSMSAPHVAGVIALLQQYKKEVEGRPLTSQEINDTLATNGTTIDDTAGSGRNFIRIDAFKSLTAIDNLFPQLDYVNTTSNLIYVYNNITFLANASDVNLNSIILESNHTGTLTNYTITNVVDGQYNYTLANNTFTAGTFQWKILVNDTHGNTNTSNWFNLTIYTGAPIITLSAPTSNTLTNNNSLIINFTATDDIDSTFNCTLFSDSILNQTKNISNGTVGEFKVNYTEGTHNWNIICNDSHLLISNSSLNTINIDLTKPYFLSETHTTTELGDNITFSVVANDTYLRSVNFSYDGVNYSLENTSTTFSKIFTTYQNGTNSFSTYTADYAGNVNASTNSFTVQDTITGPRIVNLRYSSSVTANTSQIVTMFIVDSRGISSAKLSYGGTNYSLSNNTYYNFTYSFTVSTCGTNTFKIFTNDTSNNGVTNSTSFSVTGCCGDGTCSGTESCSSCETDCGACTSSSSPAGASSSRGAGTTSSSTPTTTTEVAETISYAPETTIQEDDSTTISEASPGNPINIQIKDTLTSLFISVNENLTNIKVDVQQIETLPESTPKPKGIIFKYFEINLENLTDTSIDQANISFKVSKNWINESSSDPNGIILQRYSSRWKNLKTTLDSEDNEYYYYTALTPGFSYFAITGKGISKGINWIFVSVAIVFLLIALILFLVHELKQNED